jgi:hypothetical protein
VRYDGSVISIGHPPQDRELAVAADEIIGQALGRARLQVN